MADREGTGLSLSPAMQGGLVLAGRNYFTAGANECTRCLGGRYFLWARALRV